MLVVPGFAVPALTGIRADADLRKMVVLALALGSAPMQVILAARCHVREESAAPLLSSNLPCVPALAFLAWVTS